MTSWNEFRANEQAKIAIWQIPPGAASSAFGFASAPAGLTPEQRNNLTAAQMEGPRLIVPWTNFTIFGDHRGASYSNIVNDVFEGTPLTGGKSAQDGFLFVVYYPSADIIWLRFVHVNDEATMPVAYTPALKSRFRFYLNGIPTSAQILAAASRTYDFPPMSFGEEFFLPVPQSESEYVSKQRELRRAKVMETGVPPTRTWANVHTHPNLRDTIYYKSRTSRLSEGFRGEGNPTWSDSIDPSVPWPAGAQGPALWAGIQAPRARSSREVAQDVASAGGGRASTTTGGTSPYLYAKPVSVKKVVMPVTFQPAAGGPETREEMEVYTLNTTAGDYALLVTSTNAREILRFYTAGPTLVTPTAPADRPRFNVPTYQPFSRDDVEEIELADLSPPPPVLEEDPNDFLPPGGYEEEEEEETSGLTGSLPLILGAGAAAAYFLLNR